ncbi:hypothetical protein KP509_31G072200 [Ceratopteris richardii]|uniref:Cytochrome P450 n=1 Tax=Ceratopteris richardii TaxID=49495 RepID=A0A8T2R0K3_CERRI|nr:hypothetical protein KP509_31G072200 [Ceratopteris richardii]
MVEWWVAATKWSLSLLLSSIVYRAIILYLWRPLRVQKLFRDQGISGPPYSPIFGNLKELAKLSKAAFASPLPHITHDIVPRVLSYYHSWSSLYGEQFVFWMGSKPRFIISDPELCKEILSNKLGFYKRPAPSIHLHDLFADGLVTLEGEKWEQHRRMVNPAFYMEKLKAMVPTIVKLTSIMLQGWKMKAENLYGCKEINVSEEFKTLTADVIAHTGFGSSYAEGKEVFILQQQQQLLFIKLAKSLYIPGTRFLPTAVNRYRWELKQKIIAILQRIIDKRWTLEDGYGSDLLGLMLSALEERPAEEAQKSSKMTMQEIIDECKTFFLAGHETTLGLLTWAIMLLAIHPEWQERAREEVLFYFGSSHPDADLLHNLKVVTQVGMVLHETLRLYPPAVSIFREARQDVKLGTILVPEKTVFSLPILLLHTSPKLWGADALEFNPSRFEHGLSKACSHPLGFMPFGSGPHICVGQNFALIEAKIVISMILQNFRIQISPAYVHAPRQLLTLQPEYGMQILVDPVM